MPVNRQTLTILQHNVQTWNTKRHTLANIYNSIDPDILLLNETSVKNTDHLKNFNYNVFKTNKKNEQFAGAAIAIKKNITAQIEDDYYQDFISATIQTEHGPITVATGYSTQTSIHKLNWPKQNFQQTTPRLLSWRPKCISQNFWLKQQ